MQMNRMLTVSLIAVSLLAVGCRAGQNETCAKADDCASGLTCAKDSTCQSPATIQAREAVVLAAHKKQQEFDAACEKSVECKVLGFCAGEPTTGTCLLGADSDAGCGKSIPPSGLSIDETIELAKQNPRFDWLYNQLWHLERHIAWVGGPFNFALSRSFDHCAVSGYCNARAGVCEVSKVSCEKSVVCQALGRCSVLPSRFGGGQFCGVAGIDDCKRSGPCSSAKEYCNFTPAEGNHDAACVK